MLNQIPLPYSDDVAKIFSRIAHLPGAVWLDSGRPHTLAGRYDILTALPQKLLTPQNLPRGLSPFEYVEQERLAANLPAKSDTPFSCGLIGYFSFGTGLKPDSRAQLVSNPEFVWGLYGQSIVIDHERETATLFIASGLGEAAGDQLRLAIDLVSPPPETFSLSALTCHTPIDHYREKFSLIQQAIHSGTCYQVNYTLAHSASYSGDPLTAYLHLRKHMPAPYGGFLKFGATTVLSFSPEQFISYSEGEIKTSPIKGTTPRASDPVQDAALSQQLINSTKDRAENLMIVDLLRNDLSKVSIPKSVKVDKLFELQSFSNVHHLVSSISSRIKPNMSAMDALAAAWPGGSITGAPKKSAMQIIESIEPNPRGVYCGSIGYVNADGRLDTNICIRTIECDNEKLVCWSGGGIVSDSQMATEYAEALAKINRLLEGLSQFSQTNKQ